MIKFDVLTRVIIWRASQESDVHVHVLGINFQVSIFTVQTEASVHHQLTLCKQVMDFQPGEYLNVKEMHYNQHGMLILQVVQLKFTSNSSCTQFRISWRTF